MPEPSLLAFALSEYERRGWEMPDVHVRIFDWLASTEGERTRVLRVFRGCGKSTLLGIRNAHKFKVNPLHQLLVQGADDNLAHDLSRDTASILQSHPWTGSLLTGVPGVVQWWTAEGRRANARTPQLRAKGILSRVTGNRADEIQNDDVEVEKNVGDVVQRAKLRKKLSEQTHILKPDGSRMYVGTPHAHDSLYDELIAAGAEHLTIPLFQTQTRMQDGMKGPLWFDGDPRDVWVFVGIGAHARLLSPSEYEVQGNRLTLARATDAVVDVCTGNAWASRFTRKEMNERRKECRTLNEWDSQYQLQAKPVGNSRLNPDRITEYEVEPVIRQANGETLMLLGEVRIVGASLRWDPASGKLNSDVSAVTLCLQDEGGSRYLHRVQQLVGDIAEFSQDGREIIGGQVLQLCKLVEAFSVPRVTIETNGIGKFAPATLKAALKQRGLVCGVSEVNAVTNKAKRILESLEPLLLSGGMLWAHSSVMRGPLPEQMRSWNPEGKDQADDYLDATAGAVSETPERIGKRVKISTAAEPQHWRPTAGVFEVSL